MAPVRSQVAPGARFACRSPAKAFGEPVREVEVVRRGPHRSISVRVRWLDGEYAGLEEWVPTLRLLAPSEEVDGFLRGTCTMAARSLPVRDTRRRGSGSFPLRDRSTADPTNLR